MRFNYEIKIEHQDSDRVFGLRDYLMGYIGFAEGAIEKFYVSTRNPDTYGWVVYLERLGNIRNLMFEVLELGCKITITSCKE